MSSVQLTHHLTSAFDLVSDAVLARLDGPLEKVRGLPNQAYTSQAFFELEQQTLFPRCWTFAGVASEEISADWQVLNAEDEDLCRRMQQGRYGAYDGGRFAPYWDRGTVHIQKMVAHAVRGDGPFAPAA